MVSNQNTFLMDVLRHNFVSVLPDIQANITSCDLISIDTELSGLRKGSGGHMFDDHQERYTKIRQSCMDYSIIQFGLTCFTRQEDNEHYKSKSYNVYIFPYKIYGLQKQPERNIELQTSAISFLRNHGFDFNYLFDGGLCYLTAEEEAVCLKMMRDQEEKDRTKEMISVPEEHKEFISDCILQVNRFLEDKDASQLDLPSCNPFLRKLLYEALSVNKYRDQLDVNTRTSSQTGRDCFLSITKTSREERLEKQEQLLTEAAGFSRILRAISSSKKPVIGHNLFLDILHSVGQFMTSNLPESYQDYKEMVHSLFPVFYDTKFISSTAALKPILGNCSLEELYTNLSQDPFPRIIIEDDDGMDQASYHQAAYDSFITGHCFIAMNNFLQNKFDPKKACVDCIGPEIKRFINKLHLTYSFDLDHYDFGGPDVKLSRETILHFTFPAEWNNSHLNQLFSPFGHVKTQWINDTSILVGFQDPSRVPAFKKSFKDKDSSVLITSYEEFKRQKQEEKARDSVKRSVVSLTPVLKRVRVDTPCIQLKTPEEKSDKKPQSFPEGSDW